MYTFDWSAILSRPRNKGPVSPGDSATAGLAGAAPRSLASRVSPTVWALGFTSLLTDISSEMVASILPMYLVLQLGLSPVAFGVIDGLYQGVAALVRIAGGVLGDRWRRYKEMAAVGYGVSAVCRLLILVAGSGWTTIAGIVAIDRIGKGLRTAPRDALIALRSRSEDLATSFGVHRALDAVGAFMGPVVAFLILAKMPGAFDVLFMTSFVVAVLGLGVILLFVNPSSPSEAVAGRPPRAREALALLGEPRFRAIALTALILGVPTISDSFIFLALQARLQTGATAFPLFYVGTSIFTAILAAPAGRLADSFGRGRVLLAGYLLLWLAYLTVLQSATGIIAIALPLLLLGGYYAATDGVLTAMASAELPQSATGSGLALLATITNLARLTASILFGTIWSLWGVRAATWTYVLMLAVACGLASVILANARNVGAAREADGAAG
jgi:predicted MFS family arabinose efflux permease